jgi:hypothetical protein
VQHQSSLSGTGADGRGPGRGRTTGWLAWLLCALSLALTGSAIVLGVGPGRPPDSPPGDLLAGVILTIAFALVGVLVAVRRPQHPLGWIFCVVGLSQALVAFTEQYAVRALWTAPGSLPGGTFMAWLTTWIWAGGFPLVLTFVPLLFPDGRLPSPRWRPVAWLSAVPIALHVPIAILSWPLRDPRLVNPGAWTQPTPGALAVLKPMYNVLILVCAPACVLALVVRFRRARGVERQQLKWFMFAAAATFVVWLGLSQLAGRGLVGPGVASALIALVGAAIPVAAGIAIVRYRLYDIDRIINRTLVYGALTAILGLGYAGTVLVLGQLFGGLATAPPSWAVAGATLAVAALFQPARRRIQQAVDRRFNRRRYDAARTVEAFSTRLRHQIDLDTLSAELLAVIDQTVEPTRASLWLRPPGGAREPPPTGSSATAATRWLEPGRVRGRPAGGS